MRKSIYPRKPIHDIAWKKILKNRTALKQLFYFISEIRNITPLLDFAAAEPEPTACISRHLKEATSDIIWKIPGAGVPDCFVYVLVEHQSRPQKEMALRMLRYMANLYGYIYDESSLPLPTVIPIVLYCGERKWNCSLTFQELLDKKLPLIQPVIEARYFLVDVKQLKANRLAKIKNALSSLFLLEKARLSEWKRHLDLAVACLEGEEDRELVELVISMSYNINYEKGNTKEAEEIRSLYEKLIKEPKPMALTMREFLRKVGREDGREEGLQQGREEGLQEGLQEGLRKGVEEQLQKARAFFCKKLEKFGIDPDPYQQHLAKLADVEQIFDLYSDLLTADDPREQLRKRFGC